MNTYSTMIKYSIVIVAKDAGKKIGILMDSIRGLSDDVIVCDTGSTDDTLEILKKYSCTVHSIPWEGYGKSKNKAIGFAKHDWILSLDSDERIDQELYNELKAWQPGATNMVYQVKWKNFFGNEWIRHSDWGSNWKNRLFNKHVVRWDDAIAHEDTTSEISVKRVHLKGYLEHFSFRDEKEYASKMNHSAMITALKYHHQNKNSSYLHIIFSPALCFIKTYFFKSGFLDGRKGWLIAKTTAYYTYLKYSRLKELNQQKSRNQFLGKMVNTPRTTHS